MPNKLSQFWQELKRRKVTRVFTVYAAAAFVILELVSMSEEPFGLPEWTFVLAVILLFIGLLIAIILSWIYDIHPEGGVVRTEPAHKAKAEDNPKSSNSWKIASYISFVVIVGLIILNVIPHTGNNEILDKSIAVLPFHNDSPDEEKMYFINGTMEAILNNLCMIKDLRVPGRTSVEHYREHPKPIPVIAQEMNVSYILEGSGHRDGNNVRLYVQLLDARNDRHIWSKTYDSNIEEIFSMQSDIAQQVAAEIEAIITPEEKQLIEKKPTINLTAYDYYQRGREELTRCTMNMVSRVTIGLSNDDENRAVLERAEGLYHKALEYDTTFSLAYSGLAWIYYQKQYWEAYLTEGFLDSALILAEIALSYDNQLSEAYTILGQYHRQIGEPEQAAKEFDKALKYNPNNWEAYYHKGNLYWRVLEDFIESISNLHEAIIRYRGEELPDLLYALGRIYLDAGFIEKAKESYQESFVLSKDSILYYTNLAFLEFSLENFDEAVHFVEMGLKIDSTALPYDPYYTFAGKDNEAYNYYLQLVENYKKSGNLNLQSAHRIGYAFWMMGRKEEAEYYFNEQIRYGLESIRLGRDLASWKAAQYDLAATYAFLGEKEKAYEYLDDFNTKSTFPLWWVSLFKHDPLFDSLREEERFQNIFLDVESKHQAEHERVRQWLEENEML